MLLRILLAVLAAAGLFAWFSDRPVEHPPGILVPDAPEQTALAETRPVRHRGYHLTPVARFAASGRVLGRKAYRDDHAARLARYDLAIGWGPMSDSAVLDRYTISQDARAYRWQSEDPPLTTREVVLHSTNIHLIPANASVEATLSRIGSGDLVRLEGRLVDVLANDGTTWRTSRTRADAGVGACEILLVETLEWIER